MSCLEKQRLELDGKIHLLQAKLTYTCMVVNMSCFNDGYRAEALALLNELEHLVLERQKILDEEREVYVAKFIPEE